MCKHTRYGVTAEHTGADMFVTAHTPCENPLSLAGERAAQLYALLFMTRDSAAAGTFGDLVADIQGQLLSLAAGLAHETLVLSELAAQHEREGRGRIAPGRSSAASIDEGAGAVQGGNTVR